MGLKVASAKVIEVIEFNPKLRAIRFIPNGQFADYYPGDFLYIRVPLDSEPTHSSTIVSLSGQNEIRAYSLSSSPTQPFYEITVVEKEEEPHVSKLLQYVDSGKDVLEISTPEWFRKGKLSMGKDILAGRKLIMVGSGTGFAPFVGAARFICDKKLLNEVWLIGSFRSPDYLIFHDEIVALSAIYQNVKYFPTLTRKIPDNWQWGKRRLIVRDEQNHIVENKFLELVENPQDCRVYICGIPAMVKDTIAALEELGIASSDIRAESW